MAEAIEKPFTRADVVSAIEQNGGKADNLDLTGKRFEEGVSLDGLDLRRIVLIGAHLEKASLRDANLEGALLMHAHLEGADLGFANLDGAGLEEANLQGAHLMWANLEGTDLKFAHLERVYLHEARLSLDTQLHEVDWGNYILGEETEKFFDGAVHNYRQLKQWYTNAGIYDVAGRFFYREMEARRKSRHWKAEPHLKLWDWILRLLCGYGEKAERVIVSALVLMFGLSVAYFFLGAFSPGTFAGCLYYSIVSFTAVGYGSWVYPAPTSWAKGFGAAEAALGVFMMSLFLVTFTRKMTR
ncbi:MAG: pentapeptide repeat-containing protein [Dehalococcoidia bacterium]|nr:pentapeptide repeat-containing protein [Dehalococcoidia bacterium]